MFAKRELKVIHTEAHIRLGTLALYEHSWVHLKTKLSCWLFRVLWWHGHAWIRLGLCASTSSNKRTGYLFKFFFIITSLKIKFFKKLKICFLTLTHAYKVQANAIWLQGQASTGHAAWIRVANVRLSARESKKAGSTCALKPTVYACARAAIHAWVWRASLYLFIFNFK